MQFLPKSSSLNKISNGQFCGCKKGITIERSNVQEVDAQVLLVGILLLRNLPFCQNKLGDLSPPHTHTLPPQMDHNRLFQQTPNASQMDPKQISQYSSN